MLTAFWTPVVYRLQFGPLTLDSLEDQLSFSQSVSSFSVMIVFFYSSPQELSFNRV